MFVGYSILVTTTDRFSTLLVLIPLGLLNDFVCRDVVTGSRPNRLKSLVSGLVEMTMEDGDDAPSILTSSVNSHQEFRPL